MYDCEKCREKGLVNKLPGRWCPIYRNDEWEDEIGDNLPEMLIELSEELKTESVKILTKKLGKGVCLLGLYLTNDNIQDITLVFNCLGGMDGTELVQLPREGGILEQDAKFIRTYEIIRQEIVKHHESSIRQSESGNKSMQKTKS